MHPGFVRVTALASAALLFTGCFSVQTRRRPDTTVDVGSGGIALKVFADDDAKRAGQPGPRGLFVELERKSGPKSWEPVFRSLDPAWSVLGLPPGDYRLRFPSRLDAAGEPVALDERPRTVKVRAGEVTEVDAVLEHVDKGLVVVGVLAAVAAAVLLHEWLDDNDLPVPPLPPLPPAAIADAIFWISLDLATAGDEGWYPESAARPPVVTSHFPEEGALVAARAVNVTFVLSEPLLADLVEGDCLQVVGEESGVVPGTVDYDAERWWIVWEPEGDLPRDDTFRATLHADCVRDLQGLTLEEDASFEFRSAR